MKARVHLPFEPRRHQREAHLARKRFSVLVWHRRSGKTVFAVVELLLEALTCKKENGRFGYIAPLYKQAKLVAWLYLSKYARAIPGAVISEHDLVVKLPNGAEIRLFGADNPDSLRGLYFDGVVLDEVADMKSQVWGEIIRPALTDRNGWALFIGTPKGINLFSELYNMAVKDPQWYADLKRWSDTNALPKEEIEQARKEMSPPQFAQEFECDFAAAVINALIPLDLAMEATKRMLAARDVREFPVIIGGDVARFGDDRSVLFPRQGLMSFKPMVFRGMNTMEYASQVIVSVETYKADAAFIDEIGIGAGVVDRCKQLNHSEVIGVNSGNKATNPKYKNMWAQMGDYTLQWLNNGGCLPPDCPELITDLCAILYWYDEQNRLCVESGTQMKARGLNSPDTAAALFHTFWMPVQKRSARAATANKIQTEYEVF